MPFAEASRFWRSAASSPAPPGAGRDSKFHQVPARAVFPDGGGEAAAAVRFRSGRRRLAADAGAGGQRSRCRGSVPPAPQPLKSPGRAAALFRLLPGMGEFYAGARKRAVLFLGLEAAAWGLYFSWNGQGKEIEEDFRGVADEKWDVLRYVDWRGSTISRNSSITHALPCSHVRRRRGGHFRVPGDREAAVLRADREVRPIRLGMEGRQGPGRQPRSADRDRLGRELRFRAALRLRGSAQRQQQVPQESDQRRRPDSGQPCHQRHRRRPGGSRHGRGCRPGDASTTDAGSPSSAAAPPEKPR